MTNLTIQPNHTLSTLQFLSAVVATVVILGYLTRDWTAVAILLTIYAVAYPFRRYGTDITVDDNVLTDRRSNVYKSPPIPLRKITKMSLTPDRWPHPAIRNFVIDYTGPTGATETWQIHTHNYRISDLQTLVTHIADTATSATIDPDFKQILSSDGDPAKLQKLEVDTSTAETYRMLRWQNIALIVLFFFACYAIIPRLLSALST